MVGTKQHAEYVKCEFCGGTGGEVDESSVFGWRMSNSNLEIFITELGAQVAPVRFYNNTDTPFMPYYINPWQAEKIEIDEPVLSTLRGNFFCMPFGGNAAEFQGEKHCVHGEAAGGRWKSQEVKSFDDRIVMTLTQTTTTRPGSLTKIIGLTEGQNIIYTRMLLNGYSGPMPLGFHAILRVPEQPDSVRVSSSEFALGITHPRGFSDPANREYQSLDDTREFTDLSQVPLVWKDPAFGDCSTYPQRQGFCDLLCLLKKDRGVPAWMTAVYPNEGFLWFALKDASVLPGTAFWIDNHGRHAPPWNGRNCCLGIEDICAYFAYGLKESAEPNLFTAKGFPTAIELSPDRPTQINYMEGAVKISPNFDRVMEVVFEPDEIIFISHSGERVSTPADITFLNPDFV